MSTRLGMADGRCATINISGRILNEQIMTKTLNIGVSDSFDYRMRLQNSDPSEIIPAGTCSLFSYKETAPIISGDENNN